MPFFSVIIPTYNRLELLKQALASVWTQTFSDYEVIVVDDGSTDETWEWLATQESKIRRFRQKNAGPGSARNFAAKQATGEYLAFLDTDDLWFPWTLATYRKAFEKFPGSAFLSGIAYVGTDLSNRRCREMPMQASRFPCMFDALDGPSLPIGGTPATAVERNVFLSAGGFASGLINGEDLHLWMKLGTSEGFVRLLAPPVFQLRLHDMNITNHPTRAENGIHFLLEQESHNAYPGGDHYKEKRRIVLTATARLLSWILLNSGAIKAALKVYMRTMPWNYTYGSIKYIFGFPLFIAMHAIGIRIAYRNRRLYF
jgi:glycosyltransferase involved in cell wall biosynthesis